MLILFVQLQVDWLLDLGIPQVCTASYGVCSCYCYYCCYYYCCCCYYRYYCCCYYC